MCSIRGNCQKLTCRCNVFWNGLHLRKPRETEASTSIANCMQVLKLSRRQFTLEEIGQMWGYSRERIRQLEERALRKMMKRAKHDSIYKDLFLGLDIDRHKRTKGGRICCLKCGVKIYDGDLCPECRERAAVITQGWNLGKEGIYY